MSMHTATYMRWHKEKRVDDDVMRHPADGEAWKEFDRTFPEFAADPRNVRLGLATDGFNPYGVLNQHHSTWPIFVFPYNLPPWKCMKKEYMMMTVLITEDPGRSIDVYLRPLVDELKDLWTNGVRTYDKSTGKMLTLRAAVMWTVNDFPAYAMVSGWSTKGHVLWLPWDHEWREKDKEFDGNTERRLRPREWSGDEIVEQLNRLDFAPFGKTVNRTRPSTHMNWTHKPMFFELPYWSKLKLRHNLDVMHVEKNVLDTLVGTILDIEGKTKDTIKARLDLERMGIRRGLWMNRDSDKARRDLAFFSLKPNDKKEFLKFVSSVKFPDGYASNIARCVNVDGGKFTGLKSHDCHGFMQRLLPVDILQLRHDIVQVLCKFEMIFPPAFFTSMMHVMVPLPEEALLAGPVNYRWMYPIERLLGELKKSVRNRAKPEGSIIEAWVQYESITFCGIVSHRLPLVFIVVSELKDRSSSSCFHCTQKFCSVKMVSQQQTKDSGSKKLGMVASQDKSLKEMKFASSSAETEPTSQTTISDDSKTGRGMSTMPRVVKRKLQKLRPIVEYNKRGKGIGQAFSEMQSYIGVLAHSRVPLVDKKWSQIPKDIKEQIWEAVDMAFVVAEKAKLIDELQKQVSEGKVRVDGSKDVLTMALGPEHPGRLRGVGAGISPRQYFNLPKP
ncbi:hypothetical protein L3X38_025998 [Prunus dulcis]|uniref:DUF4218 domain-containing protein n=1 Tax=Prunus dulcis TaxID=3755 RepID=A0AAD4W2U0_PRUDU|nr:hypothetical protein L3X38_025998 [Prunus dulcis]